MSDLLQYIMLSFSAVGFVGFLLVLCVTLVHTDLGVPSSSVVGLIGSFKSWKGRHLHTGSMFISYPTCV
jgi:hypothetical protein